MYFIFCIFKERAVQDQLLIYIYHFHNGLSFTLFGGVTNPYILQKKMYMNGAYFELNLFAYEPTLCYIGEEEGKGSFLSRTKYVYPLG